MASVLEIKPLTRVEGHGSVKLFLDGNKVERVELALYESPRLFEALVIGKGYREVPDIVCRICSLCSTVHKVTALLAIEQALSITVSDLTKATRRLILNGGHIQSHALHLYCLVLPDLLQLTSVAEVARAAPELIKVGLNIKRIGNMIQETVGGRLIHPVNITVGGLGQRVARDQLLNLKDELLGIVAACHETIRLFSVPRMLPNLPAANFLAVSSDEAEFSGAVLYRSEAGPFPLQEYRQHLEERLLPYSKSKLALLKGKEPTVGALARLNLGHSPSSRMEGCADNGVNLRDQDIWSNSAAQAFELLAAVEQSVELVDMLLELPAEPPKEAPEQLRPSVGIAACEAPRGTLIHSYAFDDQGICTAADVITPTTLNHGAIARDLLFLARYMEGSDLQLLTGSLERLIRAYDPCISCAVHVVQV